MYSPPPPPFSKEGIGTLRGLMNLSFNWVGRVEQDRGVERLESCGFILPLSFFKLLLLLLLGYIVSCKYGKRRNVKKKEKPKPSYFGWITNLCQVQYKYNKGLLLKQLVWYGLQC